MTLEVLAGSGVRNRSTIIGLVLIPVTFAALGLVLRFAAYMAAVPGANPLDFANGLCRWDCLWYVDIAAGGYDPFPVPGGLAGNWAFFPFFPALVGVLHLIIAQPVIIIATATSILGSIGAALAAWPLLARNWRAYTLYCAFLLCGPFSIYFTTFYTEVAFVLLTNLVFLALSRSNYLAAGGAAALLSATRIVGVLVVFAIAVQAFLDHRARGGSLRGFVPAVLKQPRLVLAIFVAPLGLFAYMAFLYFRMGDGFAFQHMQRAFGRTWGNPLGYLWAALTHNDPGGALLSVPQQQALAAIVGFVLAGILARKRQYASAVFCAICLLAPLFAGMASMPRFVVALSPLVLLTMSLLGRFRVGFIVALAGFVVTDYFFTIGWLTGNLALV